MDDDREDRNPSTSDFPPNSLQTTESDSMPRESDDEPSVWTQLVTAWCSHPEETPETLPISAIRPRPGALEHRTLNDWTAQLHVRDLADRMKRLRQPLDPIVVARVDREWVTVDGEMRRRACERAGWKEPVPVVVFTGTAAEAFAYAVQENSKSRLVLSPAERGDAAWRLVCIGESSKSATARATGISPSCVAKMRRVHREMRKAGKDPIDYATWSEAMGWNKESDDYEFDEEAEEAKIEKLAEAFRRALPRGYIHRYPDTSAAAFHRVAGRAAAEFAMYLAALSGLELTPECKEELGLPDDEDSPF